MKLYRVIIQDGGDLYEMRIDDVKYKRTKEGFLELKIKGVF